MNIPISDLPINDDDNLDYTTEIESQKKLDESQQILKQRLGNNWKVVIFFIILFLFGLVVLILYGIPTPSSPSIQSTSSNSLWGKISEVFEESFQATKPHLKIFFIIIIVSVVFFCIWFMVKPDSDNTIYGVVPFPTNKPYIPPDSTACGTNIINCTKTKDCSVCSEKDGNNLYESTYIDPGKQVYYLGTPLQPGQYYCLPKQSAEKIKGCSTYTGKAVFTSGNGGEGWACQCLYPDLFTGDQCDEQIACSTPKNQGSPPKLVNKAGIAWDPKNMDPTLVGTTPYDRDANGAAVFTCNCSNGYNTYPNDPYVCHENLCYSGAGGSVTSVFDKESLQCICDGGTTTSNTDRTVFKSNISGYCYPYGNYCVPHPISGLCTYGLIPFIGGTIPIMFLMDGIPYITHAQSLGDILVDVSGLGKTPQVNISSSLFKDTFRVFPTVKFSDLSPVDQTAVRTSVSNDATTADIISFVIDTSSKGYSNLCNSFFYSRPGYPDCTDKLSKTGSDFVSTCLGSMCGIDSKTGEPIGTCETDIYNGHSCVCNQGNYKKSGGICINCLPDGAEEPQPRKSIPDLCCSGQDHGNNRVTRFPPNQWICGPG